MRYQVIIENIYDQDTIVCETDDLFYAEIELARACESGKAYLIDRKGAKNESNSI